MPKKKSEPVMAEATSTGVKSKPAAKRKTDFSVSGTETGRIPADKVNKSNTPKSDPPMMTPENTPKDIFEMAEVHPDTRHLTQPRKVLEEIFQDGAVEEEQEEIAIPATNDELIKAAEEMFDLKTDMDHLEAQVKQLRDRHDQLKKRVIPEAMKQLGMVNSKGKGSFTFTRGKIHLEQKLYASCSKDNEPVLFAFLEKEGDADIIKMSVNASTLSAYIRERRADGLNDPPGASIHEEVTAKLTKSK